MGYNLIWCYIIQLKFFGIVKTAKHSTISTLLLFVYRLSLLCFLKQITFLILEVALNYYYAKRLLVSRQIPWSVFLYEIIFTSNFPGMLLVLVNKVTSWVKILLYSRFKDIHTYSILILPSPQSKTTAIESTTEE